ncbi:MAG: tetratricopeptide repeat protein [Pseudomonadales bacterium]
MIETQDGLPLSTASPAAASALDAAIESYLATLADTPLIIRQITEEDPDNLMARCFMGYLTKLAGDRVNGERAAKVQQDLAQRIDGGAGTAWERSHVAALGLWVADDLGRLMSHFETLLDAFPRDALSLRMLHYLYFYDGDARRMRDSVGARMGAYAGHRLEGYIQGMYAFGLEEAGDYLEAERFGRAAVERNQRDLWATHAVAHVMQMQGRTRDGIDWLQRMRPRWADGNNFRFHLCWHESLFRLAARDFDQVLAIYDLEVAPAVQDDFYLDLCNAASLLLRLEAAGRDVGDRWQPLAEVAERHVQDTELVFASLHYLMPLLKTRSAAADELLTTLRGWAASDSTQGAIVRDVALDVAEFLGAVNAGDRPRASALHDAFRTNLHRIGGSHAQRELFDVISI